MKGDLVGKEMHGCMYMYTNRGPGSVGIMGARKEKFLGHRDEEIPAIWHEIDIFWEFGPGALDANFHLSLT